MKTTMITKAMMAVLFCNDKCINIECGQACEDYK